MQLRYICWSCACLRVLKEIEDDFYGYERCKKVNKGCIEILWAGFEN